MKKQIIKKYPKALWVVIRIRPIMLWDFLGSFDSAILEEAKQAKKQSKAERQSGKQRQRKNKQSRLNVFEGTR